MAQTKQAEADADRTGTVDCDELEAEEAQDHLKQIEERDAAGGGDDADAKFVRHLDQSGAVDHQHRQEYAEGKPDGLDGDAGVAQIEEG